MPLASRSNLTLRDQSAQFADTTKDFYLLCGRQTLERKEWGQVDSHVRQRNENESSQFIHILDRIAVIFMNQLNLKPFIDLEKKGWLSINTSKAIVLQNSGGRWKQMEHSTETDHVIYIYIYNYFLECSFYGAGDNL